MTVDPNNVELKLHNAMWPGLIGKGEGADEPAIGLDRMLALTVATEVKGQSFDGVDLFLYEPHIDINAAKSQIRRVADRIAALGLNVGSVVAPVWPDAMGGRAMGNAEERRAFLDAVEAACRYAGILTEHGVRSYGVIRIDSAASPVDWTSDPAENTKRIANTFQEAARIAEDYGERLAAEGEICWAGMHSWREMLNLLEEVGRPDVLGFQADLAHTYLFLLGYNAPEAALLGPGYEEDEFWEAYRVMTNALGPWLMDFHVAQTDGTVFGSGTHDKTGRHCPADDRDGLLDVIRCSREWLLDEDGRIRDGIRHLCWDGCMFSNKKLEDPQTWESVLGLMLDVREDMASVRSR